MTAPLDAARLAEIEALLSFAKPITPRGAEGERAALHAAIRDLLAVLRRVEGEHAQFLELLDSAGLQLNGRGIRETWQWIQTAGKTEPPSDG